MKETHLLYAVGILAFVAILAIFVSYATDTLPQQKQRVRITSPPTPTQKRGPVTNTARAATGKTSRKKKDCACCSENMEKLKAHFQQRATTAASE